MQKTVSRAVYRADMGTDVATDYLTAITSAILTAPRSLQKEIGPSGVGQPCARRIGYQLLGMEENDQRPNWKATVGTGVHLWAAETFRADNARRARWLIEVRVMVGIINGKEIWGSADLYDLFTNTVIDLKTCGPTMLKNYKRKGAGEQYKVQKHLYGRGFQMLGFPVAQVMNVFLPRQGDLDDAYIDIEPYDEQVAIDALGRLAGIQTLVDGFSWDALAILPTADQWCTRYCPYFKYNSTDLRKGCPGHPSSAANKPPKAQFSGII